MPRPAKTVPSYLLHKSSGQAIVKIRQADGTLKTHYLGPHGSPESRKEYGLLISGHTPQPTPDTANPVVAAPADVKVGELVLRYLDHAETYYRRPDGTATSEYGEFTLALRPACHLFAHISVKDFGPRALAAVRDLMVAGYKHPKYGDQPKLSRGVVNQRTRRIVRAFKWGVSQEIVPETVHRALSSVPGLKVGRSQATETAAVEPVAWADVEKTLPALTHVVRAMVLFQWHTGCRPGEACAIRVDEIDRTGPVWLYRPSYHKLAYRNRPRVIAIGKQGQEVLAPFLERIGAGGYLFSPAEAVAAVREEQQKQRQTKRYPSQRKPRKRKLKGKPSRKPSARYTTGTYDVAVLRACKVAGVEPWHPNQLRHSFATRARAAGGLEAAQVLLGHASAAITEVYAERDLALAQRIAGEIG